MMEVLFLFAESIDASAVDIPEVSAEALVTAVVGAVFGIIGLVSVIMIIYGGYQYVTSSGDSGQVSKAKRTITYAVIGLIITLFAFSITRFISDSFENEPEDSGAGGVFGYIKEENV